MKLSIIYFLGLTILSIGIGISPDGTLAGGLVTLGLGVILYAFAVGVIYRK